VCGKIAKALDKWDRNDQLEIIPSETPGLDVRFSWIPRSAYRESLQLVRARDGKTWQGAASIEQLLDVLPKGRLASWVFSIPFARPIAEKGYRWFARNRYRLGCSDHCKIRNITSQ
jgi:predicted DCC family thiol-disulfide oxidoreductase YuxK